MISVSSFRTILVSGAMKEQYLFFSFFNYLFISNTNAIILTEIVFFIFNPSPTTPEQPALVVL